MGVTGLVALSGCGGSGTDSAPESTPAAGANSAAPTSTATSSTAACDALTPAQVEAVLGRPASGEETKTGSTDEAFRLDACVWGQVTDGTVLALQVYTPGALQDPLGILLSAAGEAPTPVPSLPSGEYYGSLGLLPGGGGLGATVTWQQGSQQAALSLAAGTPGPDAQSQLITAAQQANQAL